MSKKGISLGELRNVNSFSERASNIFLKVNIESSSDTLVLSQSQLALGPHTEPVLLQCRQDLPFQLSQLLSSILPSQA